MTPIDEDVRDRASAALGCSDAPSTSIVVSATPATPEPPIEKVELPGTVRSLKAVYYLYYAAVVCSTPYQGVQLRQRGFSATWAGLIIATNPLATIMAPLFINRVERRGKQHEVLVATTVIATICYIAFACTDGAVSALLLVLFNVVMAPAPAMLDEVVLASLGPDRGGEWGAMRAWGGYGWALTAPLASVIADYFGTYALLSVVMLCCNVLFLRALAPLKRKREKSSEGLGQVLTTIRAHPFLWPRLGLTILYGLAISVVNFMYIYIASPTFAAPMWFMGFAVSLSNTIEIPLLAASPWINRHFSDKELHMISLLSWVVRLAGYTVLPSAYGVALLEPLNGFGFGCAILAVTQTATNAFPPNLTGTAVGFNFALMFGVGPLMGSSVGGYIYDQYSPNALFTLVSGMCLIALVLVMLFVPDVPVARQGEKSVDPASADASRVEVDVD